MEILTSYQAILVYEIIVLAAIITVIIVVKRKKTALLQQIKEMDEKKAMDKLDENISNHSR